MPLKSRGRGFTLIEALIALAVLSVGLLGAAAMLLESLRAQADALRQAAAANLSADMAERILANGKGCAAGCEAAQFSDADLAHFAQSAHSALPGESRTGVEFVPAIGRATPGRYVITLRWRDPRAGEENAVTLQLLAPPVAG